MAFFLLSPFQVPVFFLTPFQKPFFFLSLCPVLRVKFVSRYNHPSLYDLLVSKAVSWPNMWEPELPLALISALGNLVPTCWACQEQLFCFLCVWWAVATFCVNQFVSY